MEKSTVHPLRKIIDNLGIKQSDICRANTGRFTPAALSNMLSGVLPMTEKVKKAINDYINEWGKMNG